MRKLLICFTFLAMIPVLGWSQSISEDWILGTWMPSHGKAKVKIEKIGSKYYGKVTWLKEPNDPETGLPKTDINNPDAALKSSPRLGLRIMKDFIYDGNGIFSGGNVYDPEKGKTYCGKVTIKDQNTLDLRGYLCSASFLGRTDTWVRVED